MASVLFSIKARKRFSLFWSASQFFRLSVTSRAVPRMASGCPAGSRMSEKVFSLQKELPSLRYISSSSVAEMGKPACANRSEASSVVYNFTMRANDSGAICRSSGTELSSSSV